MKGRRHVVRIIPFYASFIAEPLKISYLQRILRADNDRIINEQVEWEIVEL